MSSLTGALVRSGNGLGTTERQAIHAANDGGGPKGVRRVIELQTGHHVDELHRMAARRAQLMAARVQEAGRLAVARGTMQRQIKSHIAWLERAINEVTAEVTEAIRARPEWRERDELYRTLTGVNALTSGTLVAEMPELGQLDRRAIGAIVGVVPTRGLDSENVGDNSDGICGGRAHVRHVLFIAAVAAIRSNPIIREYYQRLVACGKPHKVAVVACMHKMLTILNAMARTRKPWNPRFSVN